MVIKELGKVMHVADLRRSKWPISQNAARHQGSPKSFSCEFRVVKRKNFAAQCLWDFLSWDVLLPLALHVVAAKLIKAGLLALLGGWHL